MLHSIPSRLKYQHFENISLLLCEFTELSEVQVISAESAVLAAKF